MVGILNVAHVIHHLVLCNSFLALSYLILELQVLRSLVWPPLSVKIVLRRPVVGVYHLGVLRRSRHGVQIECVHLVLVPVFGGVGVGFPI